MFFKKYVFLYCICIIYKPRFLDRLSSCNAAKTRRGSATLLTPLSETPGFVFKQAFDLNGEKGSAGATLIVVTPLHAGDFTMEGEFLAESLGNDLLSNFTRGNDPNP